MRILLQFPEGLKKLALQKQRELEKQGHEVFVSGAACYGGCDLALEEAKAVGAEKLIHFGHAPFPFGSKNAKEKLSGKLEIEYEEYRIDAPLSVIEKALPLLKPFRRIGLVAPVQHVQQLGEIRKLLEQEGKEVHVGKGKRTAYPGQVLGCDAGAAQSIEKKVDAFVYFGGGRFHPLGMDVSTPVFACDPFSGQVREMGAEIEKERKRKRGALLKATGAKVFGILVSTKPGQQNLRGAEEAKRQLEKKGKAAVILVANEINPLALENFASFDCYINTACPRLSEDRERFGKPMLNLRDVRELLALL